MKKKKLFLKKFPFKIQRLSENICSTKRREINIVCIKESNFSCSYTHIMVINARNIFVCGTEKKECGSTQMFLFLFYRFFHYDFGSRGENENNHFWEKCVSNSNNSSAAQNLNIVCISNVDAMKCVYERKVDGNNILTRRILSIYNLSVETIPLFILISAVQKKKKNQKCSQTVVVRTLHQQVASSW